MEAMMTDTDNRPVIGWEQTTPVPDGYEFTPYLRHVGGELHFGGLNVAQLFLPDGNAVEGPAFPGLGKSLSSPLEVVYLPLIAQRIKEMQATFEQVIEEVGYTGRFFYTYASKANAAEEVIRTTLSSGAHHEMSSTIDVDIARLMMQRGLLTDEKMVVCNGFKPAGSHYSNNILRLRADHTNLIPVLEDLSELSPFLDSHHTFNVGLRQKCYGPHTNRDDMDEANSPLRPRHRSYVESG